MCCVLCAVYCVWHLASSVLRMFGERRGEGAREKGEVWHLGGVGLADVVDSDAVHPAVLAAPWGKVALVLHDLCVLLSHGQTPFGVDGLGLLRHRHNPTLLLLLLLPVDAVGHAEGILPVLDGGGRCGAGAGGKTPAPGGQVPAEGQAADSARGCRRFAVGEGLGCALFQVGCSSRRGQWHATASIRSWI